MKNLGKMSIRENGLGKLSGNHQRYEVISRSDLSEQSERWKKKKKKQNTDQKKDHLRFKVPFALVCSYVLYE